MKTIRSFALFVSLVTGAAACGENEAVKAAKSMANAVCACKDLACAQQALNDGTAKLMDVAATAKGTESDAKKIVDETERASKCVAALGADK
jgi:hypothetical protein